MLVEWPGAMLARRFASRCQANMAHVGQSRPDCDLGFQVKILKIFQVVPSSLRSEDGAAPRRFRGRKWNAVSLTSRLEKENEKEEGRQAASNAFLDCSQKNGGK